MDLPKVDRSNPNGAWFAVSEVINGHRADGTVHVSAVHMAYRLGLEEGRFEIGAPPLLGDPGWDEYLRARIAERLSE